MELALLVYLVENFTLNSSVLWWVAVLLLLSLAPLMYYKQHVESRNRDEILVEEDPLIADGCLITLIADHQKLKAGVPYRVRKAYSDGDVTIYDQQPESGSYFRKAALLSCMAKKGTTLPAINKQFNVRTKLIVFSAVLLIALHIVIPTKQTAYYMAGAYLIQQVGTSDVAKEVGHLTKQAIVSQLKAWSTDSPQLEALILESGVLDE